MAKKRRFDDLLAELDDIAEQLGQEQTDIEESLALYKRGQSVLTEARARLNVVEHEFLRADGGNR